MERRLLIVSLLLTLSYGASLLVYDGKTGKLAPDWNNFSWAKIALNASSVVHSGDKYAISMVCEGWKGLYLSEVKEWDVSDYNVFEFWLNGGTDGAHVVLTVTLIAANNSKTIGVADYIQPNHEIPNNEWVLVQIPLASFDLKSQSIKGFWFQANGPNAPVIYFDDIQFTYTNIPPVDGPALKVDASGTGIPINRDIFGITNFWNTNNNTQYANFMREFKIPLNRIGGDGTTRYNWKVDSSNAGFDWYFVGGSGKDASVPGEMYDNIIKLNNPLNVKTVVTIPMIQYINRESPYHCSFPKSEYPNQQSYNPYLHPNNDDCGNGKNKTGGDILDRNPLATDIPNTPEIQKEFVQHLVTNFGPSSKSNIIYQLDNEVSNWAYMHRDVHPQKVTYPEIVNQTILYAAAVKAADSSAMIAAPSEIQFGWFPDWGALKNVVYFLQELAAYEKKNGKRLVDTYDCHYPDTNNHWPLMTDVPKLKQTIDETYPGTGLSFSEWSLKGLGPLGGALAIADELGIFAANGVSWASFWGLDAVDLVSPVSYGFRIFLNFDGSGGEFGDKYVFSNTTNARTLTVHAATRSKDSALTILVINKIAAEQKSTLSLAGFKAGTSAEVFEYSINSENAIVKKPSLGVSQSGFSTTYAPFSLTMIVVPKSA